MRLTTLDISQKRRKEKIMALPYNLLKSITIDGNTAGVDTTVGGLTLGPRGLVTILSSSAEYQLSEIDVEPNSLYWVGISADFSAPLSTGPVRREFLLYGNGNLLGRSNFFDAETMTADHQYSWVLKTDSGSTQKFTVKVRCNKVQDVSGYIAAFKLLSYPE